MNENTFTIRKYRAGDKENVIKVLYETSSLPVETEEQRSFLRLMYNDYYTQQEADNCFVVADGEDNAVGYIICAEDFRRYEKIFKEKYLPEIKALGKNYLGMAKGEMLVHKFYRNSYPAHLHIDILPLCQGKGAGTQLVNALTDHLKDKGIEGLMLSCGMNNKKAVKFYKKNNFKVLMNFFGSCLMGKEIK